MSAMPNAISHSLDTTVLARIGARFRRICRAIYAEPRRSFVPYY